MRGAEGMSIDALWDELNWRRNYKAHLNSHKWRVLKANVMNERGRKCERCAATFGLQLHHKTYERLGHELLTDVELLCVDCHELADKEREIQNTRKRYARAVDTFAVKKFGEDWDGDFETVAEEFDEWLKGREDGHA